MASANPPPLASAAPQVNPPLPVRGGVQMAAVQLTDASVREPMRELIFGNPSQKEAASLLLQLAKAYIAQQTPDVRQALDAMTGSGAMHEAKFALMYCLDDMTGTQHNATSGSSFAPKFHNPDFIESFSSGGLIGECLRWSQASFSC